MGALSLRSLKLLEITNRKASLEFEISMKTMEKTALAQDQTNLTREYNARLHGKNISYYANGQYNQMTYGYLMGYGSNTMYNLQKAPETLKTDNSMILTDSRGLVIMSDQYANVLAKILGSSCMDAKGRGGTFSEEKIPAIIAAIAGSPLTEANVKQVIDGKKVDYSFNATTQNTITGEEPGKTTVDASNKYTEIIQKLVDFYYPIFQAAAANGWTTEYNNCLKENDNYISDALVSGIFQLATVSNEGWYEPDTSLTYYTLSGKISARADAEFRQSVTAWYQEQKELINEKESWLDMTLENLSTEEEILNTQMDKIKSEIEDAMKSFEWCS